MLILLLNSIKQVNTNIFPDIWVKFLLNIEIIMKRLSLLFHLIHFLFLLVSIGLVIKREELNKFFGLDTLDYAINWIILGIILYFILWIKDVLDTLNLKRKLRNMDAEKNKYKAKLYDRSSSEVSENPSDSVDLDKPSDKITDNPSDASRQSQ